MGPENILHEDWPEGLYEGETRFLFVDKPDGSKDRISLERPVGEVEIQDEHYSLETVMEAARKFGAIYEGKYVVRVAGGVAYLCSEQELRKLLHP